MTRSSPLAEAGDASAPSRGDRNLTLDGLRGLAALLVLLSHLVRMPARPGCFGAGLPQAAVDATGVVGMGGVLLFFLISGYLIAQSLARRGDVRAFLVSRAVRLYPVFLPLHLAMFTLGPLAGYEWMGGLRDDAGDYVASFAANLLFLPGVLSLPLAQKNAWSLSYEAAFYLLAAAGFLAWRRWRADRRQGAALLAAYAVAAAAFAAWQPMALFFAAGAAVFVWEPRLGGGRRASALRHGAVPALLGVFLLQPVSLPLAALCGGFGFVSLAREWGAFSALLRHPGFVFLGRISYSLYLTHPFVLVPLRALLREAVPMVGAAGAYAAFAAVGFAASVGAGYASYRLIEVGFTRRFLCPRERGPASPVGRTLGRRSLPEAARPLV